MKGTYAGMLVWYFVPVFSSLDPFQFLLTSSRYRTQTNNPATVTEHTSEVGDEMNGMIETRYRWDIGGTMDGYTKFMTLSLSP